MSLTLQLSESAVRVTPHLLAFVNSFRSLGEPAREAANDQQFFLLFQKKTLSARPTFFSLLIGHEALKRPTAAPRNDAEVEVVALKAPPPLAADDAPIAGRQQDSQRLLDCQIVHLDGLAHGGAPPLQAEP